MSKVKHFLLLVFLLSFSATSWAINAGDVAVIDLSMALSLHPKMALFDFNRIGFYKVDFGLSEEDFQLAIQILRNKAPDTSEERARIQSELKALQKERDSFADYYVNITEEKMKKVEELRASALKKEEELLARLMDLEYIGQNNDITTPSETLKIAAQIEAEIMEAVNQVASEQHFSLVLNSTVPTPYGYPKQYITGEIYGQGIPGINFMLFYSFLAKNNLAHPMDEAPSSRELINWMELTRYPEALNILPMRPYPLVLTGGKSILSDVVKKIYDRYNIDTAIYKVVDSVIIKMEQIQNGKMIEKKQTKYER